MLSLVLLLFFFFHFSCYSLKNKFDSDLSRPKSNPIGFNQKKYINSTISKNS